MQTGRNSGSVERRNSDFGIGVAQLRQAIGDDDLGAPDDPADRLGEEEIADHVVRQAMAAIDLDARGRRKVVQRAIGHADAAHAALHVGDAARRRVGHLEVRLEVVRDVERAVDDRHLEVHRADLAAAVDPPHLAVVVLRRPPLPAVRISLLAQDLAVRREAQAERVVGHVEPVVERPGQPARLPLHVRDATRRPE